jgi:hypothetical protein
MYKSTRTDEIAPSDEKAQVSPDVQPRVSRPLASFPASIKRSRALYSFFMRTCATKQSLEQEDSLPGVAGRSILYHLHVTSHRSDSLSTTYADS